MHCKHCGKEIENDSKFCTFCGGKTSQLKQSIEEKGKTSVAQSKCDSSQVKAGNNQNKLINLFLIWIGFNAFALITSYSKVSFFGKNWHSPQTEKFWPLVKVFEYKTPTWNAYIDGPTPPESYWKFNGLFYNYDWSEFLVYVGLVGLYFIVNKNSKTQTK